MVPQNFSKFDPQNAQVVFSKEYGNASNYRIPSLCVAQDSKLIACADERFFGSGDNPNRIDKVIRISQDNGISWGAQITAVRERGETKNTSSAAIDPALLYDKHNNQLFMLYCHTPAGVGILNCKRTTGYQDGYKLLKKGRSLYQIKDNQLYKGNESTGITVDDGGNLSTGGNYTDSTSDFRELGTSYLMVTKSNDNGLTWEKPICLSPQVKDPSWGFIGACPGNGIQISKGTHQGRLLFPIYYALRTTPLNLTFSCIYSDDFGKTWNIGSPPEIKGRFPKSKPFLILPRAWQSETQIVENSNGDIIAYIRNHHPAKLVMTATSTTGGVSFGSVSFLKEAPQPICQISSISFEYDGKHIIALLNAASRNKRENGTIRLSIDDGKTFPYSKLLFPSQFAYSSMAYLGDGLLGILYEDSLAHDSLKYITFSLKEFSF